MATHFFPSPPPRLVDFLLQHPEQLPLQASPSSIHPSLIGTSVVAGLVAAVVDTSGSHTALHPPQKLDLHTSPKPHFAVSHGSIKQLTVAHSHTPVETHLNDCSTHTSSPTLQSFLVHPTSLGSSHTLQVVPAPQFTSKHAPPAHRPSCKFLVLDRTLLHPMTALVLQFASHVTVLGGSQSSLPDTSPSPHMGFANRRRL